MTYIHFKISFYIAFSYITICISIIFINNHTHMKSPSHKYTNKMVNHDTSNITSPAYSTEKKRNTSYLSTRLLSNWAIKYSVWQPHSQLKGKDTCVSLTSLGEGKEPHKIHRWFGFKITTHTCALLNENTYQRDCVIGKAEKYFKISWIAFKYLSWLKSLWL